MARQPTTPDHAPVCRVLRSTAAGCAAVALALVLGDWGGAFGAGGAETALPAAVVLGFWSCLLSLVLLLFRARG